MKAMEEKILREGTVLPGNILKVGSFLNQQIDVDFINEMGKAVADLFAGEKITKVITVEASGIAFAFAVASYMHIPMAYAKKAGSANVGDNVYSTVVHSYTHNKDYPIVISKEYLNSNDRVLLVDDFLACGNALRGLIRMAKEAGADVVGCVAAVEKGFQGGGDSLRAEGFRVESLAIVESMTDSSLIFRA